MVEKVLEIKNLKTYFMMENKVVRAVDDISFSVEKGESFGLVGESGCGKTVTALSIMRLVPYPGRIISGDIIYEGKNLLSLDENDMRKMRGRGISMIFQDPTSSLNPVLNIGYQIGEVLRFHEETDDAEVEERTKMMLSLVGIEPASEKMKNYPFELSGGMRQRVMIAIALMCSPRLLIADEPTTNLDATIQAQVVEIMKELKKKFGTSIILITHDMGLVAEMCRRVAVMYASEIVEIGDLNQIFYDPLHPYTKGLINCIPRSYKKDKPLQIISGSVFDLSNQTAGCKFYQRCPYAMEVCSKKNPHLNRKKGRSVACHLYQK